MALIKKNIKSKNTLQKLFKGLMIFLITIFIVSIPYLVFTIQYSTINNKELYTYLDDTLTNKGEPINIVIPNSNLSKVITSLETEGWKEVPTYSPNDQNTWQFSINNGITPISQRYFNKTIQQISLEGPNSTVSHRHHARFWEIDGDIYGTVSYDSNITIMFKKLIPIPTHEISQNIDKERDAVGKIISVQLDLIVSYKDNIPPSLYQDNNANSWYYTDGEIMILKNTPESNFQQYILNTKRFYFKILGVILNLF